MAVMGNKICGITAIAGRVTRQYGGIRKGQQKCANYNAGTC